MEERQNSDGNTKRDLEHLRLLSIFHYVVAGITALFACFPIIHFIVGLAIFSKSMGDHSGNAPPAFFGLFFMLFAAVIICLGWALAIAIFVAGKKLSRRVNYTFCLVMAGIECVFIPFGTVLGVLTIITLTRPGAKELFSR